MTATSQELILVHTQQQLIVDVLVAVVSPMELQPAVLMQQKEEPLQHQAVLHLVQSLSLMGTHMSLRTEVVQFMVTELIFSSQAIRQL